VDGKPEKITLDSAIKKASRLTEINPKNVDHLTQKEKEEIRAKRDAELNATTETEVEMTDMSQPDTSRSLNPLNSKKDD